MATIDDVRRIALTLPATTERTSYGNVAWAVREKTFVWERPLGASDVAALGGRAPTGIIIAVRTDGLEMKDALIASDPSTFFTVPHFDGYQAVLIRLSRVSKTKLEGILVDAWLARAPKRASVEFLAARRPS